MALVPRYESLHADAFHELSELCSD